MFRLVLAAVNLLYCRSCLKFVVLSCLRLILSQLPIFDKVLKGTNGVFGVFRSAESVSARFLLLPPVCIRT